MILLSSYVYKKVVVVSCLWVLKCPGQCLVSFIPLTDATEVEKHFKFIHASVFTMTLSVFPLFTSVSI